MSLLDPGQIVKKAYREASQSVKIHITGSDLPATSSVSITDGGNTASIDSDGALLVNQKSYVSAGIPLRINHSSINISSTYYEIVASTAFAINALEIFDSSGETLALAAGALGAEVPLINIFPGGNGRVLLYIAQGTRLSIRSLSGTTNTGELNINFFGTL